MASIAECVALSRELEALSDSARLDTEVILAWVLNKSRTYLYTWPEKMISEAEYRAFTCALNRRKQGEPVAHITGEREFWSLDFFTDHSTLIPRPDTESLVEFVLAWLDERSLESPRILDLGTGTGAIAVALATSLPNASVTAVDYSESAVSLAQKNAARHQVNNLSIFQSDWFSNVSGTFDAIVSNPPYIACDDPHLTRGDVRYEPASALVAENDGFLDIQKICGRAAGFLTDGGVLCVEHGWQQALGVQRIFIENEFQAVSTYQDLSGNDRFTVGVVDR